jgi:hypothetical protein
LKKPLAILDSIILASSIKNLGENTKPKHNNKKPNSKVQNVNSKILLELKKLKKCMEVSFESIN